MSLREDQPLYAGINLGHPLLESIAYHAVPSWGHMAVSAGGLGSHTNPLLPIFALSRSRLGALPSTQEPLRLMPPEGACIQASLAREVRTFLEMVIFGTIAHLNDVLGDMIHIGPLRAIPRPRLQDEISREARWEDGLAAWDALLDDRGSLVEHTNRWLDRLGAGCRVVAQPLQPTSSADRRHSCVHRLCFEARYGSRVLPSEVGAGIAQLLPVIVALLRERAGLSLIELPEAHVHPSIAVGLGDLFIEAASRIRRPRTTLVETHSEHIALRVLRRIRQTTDGELPPGILPFSTEQLSVLHVDDGPQGLQFDRLRVSGRGEFVDRWPTGRPRAEDHAR